MAAGTSATAARRKEVLRAIVADYIHLQGPVGSKALLERHNLNVSSATIRNDMAVLESEGYIVQEHASSGRVPTQRGYRAFVDTIEDLKPLSAAEKRAIFSFLSEGVDLEDVMRRSVQLLSQITNQAAVIQMPTLRVSRVKHCEVVALSPLRVLVVMITDTGRVDQRNVALTRAIAPDQVVRLREMLNNALQDKTLTDASVAIAQLASISPPDLAEHVQAVATIIVETLVEQPNDRIIMAGASNLTQLAGIIDALEEQVLVLKLMANLPDVGDVAVRIGEENEDEELRSASIVTTAYGGHDLPLGGLGVVGPTYMDYPETMSRVSVVAQYVGRILSGK